MKKVKWLVLCIVISLVVMIVLFSCKKEAKFTREILIEEAINTGNILVKTYTGKCDISNINKEYVSDDVIKVIEDFDKQLKKKDNNVINVESFFLAYSEVNELGIVKESGSDKVLLPYTDEIDERIEYRDNVPVIPISKLDPNGEGFDSIPYKGIRLIINITEEFESYDKMIKNPNYVFSYSSHKVVEDAKGVSLIRVSYTSTLTRQSKIVTFKVDGNKIVAMELS